MTFKTVNLDALERELENWRGEVPLPCDIVVALIAELRSYREAPGVLSTEDSEAFQQLLNAPAKVVPALAKAMRERRAREPQGAPDLPCDRCRCQRGKYTDGCACQCHDVTL